MAIKETQRKSTGAKRAFDPALKSVAHLVDSPVYTLPIKNLGLQFNALLEEYQGQYNVFQLYPPAIHAMKAIVLNQSLPITDPNALFEQDMPKPECTGHDLLIKVEAISINPVDAKVRLRALPEKAALGGEKILGFDAVGTVEATGELCELFKVGDQVFYAGDVGRQGSNAEYQLVDERIVGKAPSKITSADAAALPLTALTAYEMVFERLQISHKGPFDQQEPTLLITGAAGGVGSIMIQLIKALSPEVTVIATASRKESQDWCKKMGADHVIDHHAGIQKELDKLGIREVSHIASLTHTSQHFADFIEVIKPQGKIALIDDPSEPVNFQALKMKCVSLHWEFMFTRAKFETEDMIKQHHILNQVSELLDNGDIKTTATMELGKISTDNLKTAHGLIEAGNTIGKIVLAGF